MTATPTTRSAAGMARRATFVVSAAALALMTAVLMLPNLVPPLVTEWGGAHFLHDLMLTLCALILLTGLAAQVRAPRERVGAMVVVLAFPALFVVVGTPATGFVFPPLIIMLVLALIATASHPASWQLLRPVRARCPATAALTVVWAVPAIVYAVGQFDLQRVASAADPHAEHGHWAAAGVVVLVIALLAAVDALRPAGWRVAAGTASVAAVALGVASVGFSELPSSLGVGWGLAATAWGLAIGALAIVAGRGEADRSEVPRPTGHGEETYR